MRITSANNAQTIKNTEIRDVLIVFVIFEMMLPDNPTDTEPMAFFSDKPETIGEFIVIVPDFEGFV